MSLAKKRGEQEVNVSPPDTIGSGGKTVSVAGTAETLASTQECRFVIIYAKAGNTGNVFYGGSNVSSTVGGVLEQARDSGWFQVDNLSKIYIDAANSSDGVSYVFVV